MIRFILQTVIPIILLIIPITILEIVVRRNVLMLAVVNAAAMIASWQNTVNPVICFIYIRPLRLAFHDIIKPLMSSLHFNLTTKVSDSVVQGHNL